MSPSKPSLCTRAFTLVEILVVVIIVGLMAGIAVWKLTDTKDQSDINYLKSSIHALDVGIERVIAVKGTFPTIVTDTPEARLEEIITVLRAENIYVALPEETKLFLAQVASSDSFAQILLENEKARKGKATGTPDAREILVLPRQGPITYPEPIVLVLNDPNSPNVAWHGGGGDSGSGDIAAQAQSAFDYYKAHGDFQNDTARNLVLSNLGLINATSEDLASLFAIANGSQLVSSLNQLAGILNGSVVNPNINAVDAMKLLSDNLSEARLLSNMSALNLTGVDYGQLSPYALSTAIKAPTLSSAQKDQVITALAKPEMLVGNIGEILKALNTSGMSPTQQSNLADTLIAGITAVGGTSNGGEKVGAYLDYLASDSIMPGFLASMTQSQKDAAFIAYLEAINHNYDFGGSNSKDGLWRLEAEVSPSLLDPIIDSVISGHGGGFMLYGWEDGKSLFANGKLIPSQVDKLANWIGGMSTPIGEMNRAFMETQNLSDANVTSLLANLATNNTAKLSSLASLAGNSSLSENSLQNIMDRVLAAPIAEGSNTSSDIYKQLLSNLAKGAELSSAQADALLAVSGDTYKAVIAQNLTKLTDTQLASLQAGGLDSYAYQAAAANKNLTADQISAVVATAIANPTTKAFSGALANANLDSASLDSLLTAMSANYPNVNLSGVYGASSAPYLQENLNGNVYSYGTSEGVLGQNWTSGQLNSLFNTLASQAPTDATSASALINMALSTTNGKAALAANGAAVSNLFNIAGSFDNGSANPLLTALLTDPAYMQNLNAAQANSVVGLLSSSAGLGQDAYNNMLNGQVSGSSLQALYSKLDSSGKAAFDSMAANVSLNDNPAFAGAVLATTANTTVLTNLMADFANTPDAGKAAVLANPNITQTMVNSVVSDLAGAVAGDQYTGTLDNAKSLFGLDGTNTGTTVTGAQYAQVLNAWLSIPNPQDNLDGSSSAAAIVLTESAIYNMSTHPERFEAYTQALTNTGAQTGVLDYFLSGYSENPSAAKITPSPAQLDSVITMMETFYGMDRSSNYIMLANNFKDVLSPVQKAAIKAKVTALGGGWFSDPEDLEYDLSQLPF